MAELALSEDGERTLQGAEALCRATNVSILAAEHLLASALECARGEAAGLPASDALANAAFAVHGAGTDDSGQNVMWGSSAREALNATIGVLRERGTSVVSARLIALGVIASGEVNPMFYASLGLTRADLAALLQGTG